MRQALEKYFKFKEIINWEDPDIIIQEVEVINDFGPLKVGERFYDISFELDGMICGVYNEEGDKLKEFNFNIELTVV